MPAAAHDAPCPASPRSKTVIWQPAAARRHPIPRPATPAPITATRGKARRQPLPSNTGQVWTAIRRATPSAGMIQVRFDGYDLSRHALAPTPQPDTNVVGALQAEGKLQDCFVETFGPHRGESRRQLQRGARNVSYIREPCPSWSGDTTRGMPPLQPAFGRVWTGFSSIRGAPPCRVPSSPQLAHPRVGFGRSQSIRRSVSASSATSAAQDT